MASACRGSGDVLWARHFGASGLDYTQLASNEAGETALFGGWFSSSDGGPFELTGDSGFFVAGLDAEGSTKWTRGYPAAPQFWAQDVHIDADGNVATVGKAGYAQKLWTTA